MYLSYAAELLFQILITDSKFLKRVCGKDSKPFKEFNWIMINDKWQIINDDKHYLKEHEH